MHSHLNDAELADICRPLTQHAARIRYLRTLGLRVDRRPDGSPLVRRADWEAHHNWFEVDDWDDGDDDGQDGPACGHCGAGVNPHDEDECWHCGADL